MSSNEKAVYEKKAKCWNEENKEKPKVKTPKKTTKEKYTSEGVPLSFIKKENQEKEEKRTYKTDKIKQMTSDAFLDNGI